MKAEVPGQFWEGRFQIKNTAQILCFLCGSVLLFVVLISLADMPLYDNFVIAMGTAGARGLYRF